MECRSDRWRNPILITFNEAPNIARTLNKLGWARRIVVVDNGSSDGTLEILARFPQVGLFTRAFDNFADQCNFGLAQVHTDWALSLDADYELSDSLVQELSKLGEDAGVAGYRASFVYRILGRPLHGTLYPPRVVLYRVKNAHYVNEGHGHRVLISGDLRAPSGVIYHVDRKPLSRWFTSQQGMLGWKRTICSRLMRTPFRRQIAFVVWRGRRLSSSFSCARNQGLPA